MPALSRLIKRCSLAIERQNCRISIVVLRRQYRNDLKVLRQFPAAARAVAPQICDTVEELVAEVERLANINAQLTNLQ